MCMACVMAVIDEGGVWCPRPRMVTRGRGCGVIYVRLRQRENASNPHFQRNLKAFGKDFALDGGGYPF
jgi:hypothetical protein